MLNSKPQTFPHSTKAQVKCESCLLSKLCLPASLNNVEILQLDEVQKSKTSLNKNEVLFHSGESKQRIFAVNSGTIKTSIMNDNGMEQITGFYLPGELFGLDGLAGNAYSTSATAIESSSVCEISEPDFDKLCETNHGLRQSFMRIVSHEIANENKIIMSLGQMNSEEKLASFLISLSSRFKLRGFSPLEFNLSMPRNDIANFLGVTIETISRLFKKFQTEGLLTVHNRNIHINDRDKLCDLAHASCAKHQPTE